MTTYNNDKRNSIPIYLWQNGKSKEYSFVFDIPLCALSSIYILKEHIAEYISLNKSALKKHMNINGQAIKRIYNNHGVEIDEYDLQNIKANDLFFISFDISAPFYSCNYYNQYIFIKWIKSGGFGKVYLAKHIISGIEYAIKQIDTTNCNRDDIETITNENIILQSLKHKNIIKYHHSFSYEDSFYTVMDYAKGGELSMLLKEKKRLNEKEARRIFKQIYKAVCFIHTKNIIHRDLKPNNILFLDENRTHVVLIDFGISGVSNGNNKDIVKAGTTTFLAPEVASGDNYSSSPKLDVWSLGVILFKMIQGVFPFEGKNDAEITKKILNFPIQFNKKIKMTNQCKELIKGLLEKTISFRLNMDAKEFNNWFDLDNPLRQEEIINNTNNAKLKEIEKEEVKVNVSKSVLSIADNNTNNNNKHPTFNKISIVSISKSNTNVYKDNKTNFMKVNELRRNSKLQFHMKQHHQILPKLSNNNTNMLSQQHSANFNHTQRNRNGFRVNVRYGSSNNNNNGLTMNKLAQGKGMNLERVVNSNSNNNNGKGIRLSWEKNVSNSNNNSSNKISISPFHLSLRSSFENHLLVKSNNNNRYIKPFIRSSTLK